jgi:hypothetical protein
MTNFKHKSKFTFNDASNLKALDIPGLIAKRSGKKHLNSGKGQPRKNKEARSQKRR